MRGKAKGKGRPHGTDNEITDSYGSPGDVLIEGSSGSRTNLSSTSAGEGGATETEDVDAMATDAVSESSPRLCDTSEQPNDEPGDGPGDGPDDKPVLDKPDDHGYSPYSPDQDVPFLCREDMSVCGYKCGQCDKASEVKCAVCDDMMCFSHVNGVAASEFWPESRVCKDCFLELTAHQIAHSLSRFSGSDVLPVSFAHLLRLL